MLITRLFPIVYWIWIGSETLLQFLMRTRRSEGEIQDRGSLFLLLPVLFCSVWAALEYGGSHAHNLLGGGAWLLTAGLILMVAGLAIRWTAILSLGRAFSTNVAIRSTQTLYEAGIYRWLRHPSYTGMMLCFASIGVYTRNWVSLLVVVVFPALAISYRIHVEERALLSAFGSNYERYRHRTWRIVPGIY